MALWNLWHGCHKISEGCRNCYVYRMDEKYERNSSEPVKTRNFDLPMKKNRQGLYKVPPGEIVYTCFTSDFLLEEADEWRKEAWEMIKMRSDLKFMFITKRIHRFASCVPYDWGDGYENVIVGCTVENQQMADYRLPIFMAAPIQHKMIICEPLLGEMDLTKHLSPVVEAVVAGGESGNEARVCRYEWILSLRRQCVERNIAFCFKQTGAKFIKDGKFYRIQRRYQHAQARKAGLNFKTNGYRYESFD